VKQNAILFLSPSLEKDSERRTLGKKIVREELTEFRATSRQL
jgi:hypothetical protein